MKKKTTKRFESKEIKRNQGLNDDTKKIISFIVILFIVLGLLIGLYMLNGNYVTKDLGKETTTTAEVNFDDSVITINEVFKNDGYVLLYDKKDKTDGFLYDGLVTSYKNDKIDLYSVDMSLKLNSKYYDKNGKENKSATKYEELVITGPTLLEIKKGKINNYITDQEKIIDLLKPKASK